MNLDDSATFKKLDPADMLAEIDALPDQLADAWALGQRQPLGDISGIRQLVLAGMEVQPSGPTCWRPTPHRWPACP